MLYTEKKYSRYKTHIKTCRVCGREFKGFKRQLDCDERCQLESRRIYEKTKRRYVKSSHESEAVKEKKIYYTAVFNLLRIHNIRHGLYLSGKIDDFLASHKQQLESEIQAVRDAVVRAVGA